jgi:1,4-alpha-glucan branching enzyme
VSKQDEGDKIVIVERGDLLFVFNFHPTNSYTDYRVGCKLPGEYQVVLSSDEEVFGGYRNVTKDSNVTFTALQGLHNNRPYHFYLYAPSRTVVVYAPAESCDPFADSKPHGVPGLGVRDLGPYYSR